MSNREKFEAFLVSEYAWANDALNAAFFHGDDATGYYIGGDYIYDGQSCSECLFWAWRGWQAASKASEQQLAAVVAENAGLKTYRTQPHGAAMMEALDAFFEREDVPEQGMMASFEILCCKRPPTPATDAAIANIQAQGVEMLATAYDERAKESTHYMIINHCKVKAEQAREFAAQLRQGAAL